MDPFSILISLYCGFTFSCNDSARKYFDYPGSIRLERKRECREGNILYVDRSAHTNWFYMWRLFDDLSFFCNKFSLYIYFYRLYFRDGVYKEEVCKAARSDGSSFPHMVAVSCIYGGTGYGSIWVHSVLDCKVYSITYVTFSKYRLWLAVVCAEKTASPVIVVDSRKKL